MIKVLEASVSFPGVFSPVEALGSLWFTGSAVHEIDVTSPIVHCAKLGYAEKDIIIDVILGGNPHLPNVKANNYNGLQMVTRTFTVYKHYETMLGVLRAKAGHPDVNVRYMIGPS